MFSRVRIAIRFFVVGLAVGMLLAPRSGEQTRRLVREKADRLLNDILDAATLGTYESGAGATDTGTGTDEEAAAPAPATRAPRSRSGNGSRKSSSSTTEPTATTPAS